MTMNGHNVLKNNDKYIKNINSEDILNMVKTIKQRVKSSRI